MKPCKNPLCRPKLDPGRTGVCHERGTEMCRLCHYVLQTQAAVALLRNKSIVLLHDHNRDGMSCVGESLCGAAVSCEAQKVALR